ncbi:hypothetical protein [Polynucleobacter ibericus]|nr:hypothetical protein [Polynucleobacter ibericus]QWE08961.1 hypothetical protein AOC20_01710 [Polynucleobacter ibericus]
MKQPNIADDMHQEAEAFDSQIEELFHVETEVLNETKFLFVGRKVNLL